MQPLLRLLGRFELALGTGPVLTVSGARAQLLLARLALANGDRLDRALLSAMLWGERADAQARASLRQQLWALRQELKALPDALVTEGDFVRLDPALLSTDVARFDTLAASSDTSDLETALALYRGDLLDGIDLIALEPDGYFLHERNRLRDLALRVAGALANAHDRSNSWEDIIRTSRRGLMIDPFDEALHLHLVRALQKLGRHREARDQDDAFRSRMKSELGVLTAPQAVVGLDLRASSPALPADRVDPKGPVPPRRPLPSSVRLGAMALFVLVLGLGIWRQASGPSAALPIPDATTVSAVKRNPSPNLEAYDRYMRAEAQRKAATDDDQLRSVLAAYRMAFTLDETFAAAYAGYALVAVRLWEHSLNDPVPSLGARRDAYDAAGRALQIDPGNARAMTVLSRIQAQDGARDSALVTARQAVAADRGEAEARANLALLLSYAGQTSAARSELTQLRRLDPLPRPQWMMVFGQAAFADERYDAAIADFVAVWPDQPRNTLLLEHLAAALALQGRLRQASDMKDRLLAVMPRANLHLIAQRYATLREPRQNQRLIEGLRRAGLPDWPYGFRASEDQRVTGDDLAAIVTDVKWSGRLADGSAFTLHSDAGGGFTYSGATDAVAGQQAPRDGLLCQTPTSPPAAEVCGPIYRHTSDLNPESTFAFVTAQDVRFFSVVD